MSILATASTNDVVIAAFTTVAAVVATVWGATRSTSKSASDVKEAVGTPPGDSTIAEMLSAHTVKLSQLDDQIQDLSNNFNAYQLKAIAAREDFNDQLHDLEKHLPKEG